jgi:hypothetical protein
VSWANSWCFPIQPCVRFIAILGNTVGAGCNYLDLLVSHFLFPIRYLVTKSDLRCFVALAEILPTIRYVPTRRSNTLRFLHKPATFFLSHPWQSNNCSTSNQTPQHDCSTFNSLPIPQHATTAHTPLLGQTSTSLGPLLLPRLTNLTLKTFSKQSLPMQTMLDSGKCEGCLQRS